MSNATVPPSLSKEGQIHSGKKADLLDCLERSCDVISIKPAIQGIVIEGAVLVNIIRPNGQRSFSEYFKQRLLPYLSNLLQSVQRFDVVWDVYQTNSLKMSTRLKRGDGSRRKVGDATPLPEKWNKFLRVDENKTDLFHYIANCVCTELFKIDEGKHIVTTYKDSVISSDQNVPNDLAPCNHEEGDYRSVLHAFHMSKKQLRNVMISTVDTDVVVIAVSSFKRMALDELWIGFGTGENRRYIPIHEIVFSLGPHISASLLFFHSFTGCDQVSYFATHGKKTAWKTWENFPQITTVLQQLSQKPTFESIERNMSLIERFVCLLYHPSSSKTDVNECRRQLFVKHSRQLEGLPSTKAALYQHTLRAAYQAGYVW